MSSDPIAILRQARELRVLVDTNLLLVFAVYLRDRNLVRRFKRTAAYSADDGELLVQTCGRFAAKLACPNVWTEVSNLCSSLGPEFHMHLATIIAAFQEYWVSSEEGSTSRYFAKFGLTDGVLHNLTKGDVVLLTDDLRLASALEKSDALVLNFNHLRVQL